jgi:hypothetical protein
MVRMLRFATTLSVAAAVTAVLAAGASAAGDLTVSTVRHSHRLQLVADYIVWDKDDTHCVMSEEEPFFDNDACFGYFLQNADLDLRVYRSTHNGWRLLYRQPLKGKATHASATIDFSRNLRLPLKARAGTHVSFRYVVRLFDPLERSVASTQAGRFTVSYR